MIVFIDPGHGNTTGAKRGDCLEDEFTLDIATPLKQLLEFFDIRVIMARDKADEHPTHSERFRLALDRRCDFAISIHANTNEDPTIGGMMTFYKEGDWRGKAAAAFIIKDCPDDLKRHGKYRGERYQQPTLATAKDWPRVLNCLDGYVCPAVLVECGFMSNGSDLDFMWSLLGRRLIALGLLSGFLKAIKHINRYPSEFQLPAIV